MLAVGEHLWGEVDDRTRRMSSALAGGVGCTYEELCGTLSGGALIIGAEYGRTSPEQDDEVVNRLAALYRERFVQHFGTSRCFDIRDSGYGAEGQWPCSTAVAQATRILLEVLASETP